MEHLEAFSIPDLGIKLQREGDLLYHEGALLSHFINEEDEFEHYFYKWSDCDDTVNRWMIFRVSISNLYSFFKSKTSLFTLINKNPFVYFIDLDSNIHQKNLVLCSIDKIPTDYLPSENSFFQEDQYSKYADDLRRRLENSIPVQAFHTSKAILELAATQKEQSFILNSILNQLDTLKPQIGR